MTDAMGLMSTTNGPASAWAAAIEIFGAFCSNGTASIDDLNSVLEEFTDGVDPKLGPPILEFLRVARAYDVGTTENQLNAVTRLRDTFLLNNETKYKLSLQEVAVVNAAFERILQHAVIRVRSPVGYPLMWCQAWNTIVSALDSANLDETCLEEELGVVLGGATKYRPWTIAKEVFGGTSHHFSSRVLSLRAITDICVEHLDAWPSNGSMLVHDCRALFAFDWYRIDNAFDNAAKDATQSIIAFVWTPETSFNSLDVKLGQLLGPDRLRQAPWSVLRDLLQNMPEEQRKTSHRMVQDLLISIYEVALERQDEQIKRAERRSTLTHAGRARKTRRVAHHS